MMLFVAAASTCDDCVSKAEQSSTDFLFASVAISIFNLILSIVSRCFHAELDMHVHMYLDSYVVIVILHINIRTNHHIKQHRTVRDYRTRTRRGYKYRTVHVAHTY